MMNYHLTYIGKILTKMKDQIHENKLPSICLITVLLAFIIKMVFYFSLMNSVFKYYAFIETLDMWTLLKWGVGVAFNGEAANNLYVLLIATISRLADRSLLSINAIIAFQLTLGMLTIVLTIYIAWLLFRSRTVSFLSGFLTALYAPLLLYEGFILKTSLIVFLSNAFIFCSIYFLKGKRKRFSIVCSGIFAGLLLTANFGSLCLVLGVYIWLVCLKIKDLKKICFFVLFPLSLLSVLILFFIATGFKSFPVLNSLSDTRWQKYIFNVGNQRQISSLNEPVEVLNNKVSAKLATGFDIVPYLKKICMLFSSEEVPDNINYCFIRDGIFPLKYMISPFLLYSLAIPSLLMFLCIYKERMAKLTVGIILACMFIPIIIFVPLSRYSVFYAPMLCVVTAWGIYFAAKVVLQKKRKEFLFILLLFISGFCLQSKLNPQDILRASDFVAYANALEMQNPNDSRIDYAYEQAYLFDSDSIPLALKYVDILTKRGDYKKSLIVYEKLKTLKNASGIKEIQKIKD